MTLIDKAEAHDDDLIRRVAAAMWKAEIIDAGVPQAVTDARTPEAFSEQSDYIRAKWMKLARAAIASLPARGVGADLLQAMHDYLCGEAPGLTSGGQRNSELRARILAALEPARAPDLSDPVVVHLNMLRGTIAKPTVEQIIHLYGREAFRPMIDAAVAKALEKACLAVSEHADWPEDEHGRTEQVGLFARVINAIRAIAPALSLAPTDAAHVNETPKSEHDGADVLTDAALIARLREIQGQAGLFASAAADRIEALMLARAEAAETALAAAEAEVSALTARVERLTGALQIAKSIFDTPIARRRLGLDPNTDERLIEFRALTTEERT